MKFASRSKIFLLALALASGDAHAAPVTKASEAIEVAIEKANIPRSDTLRIKALRQMDTRGTRSWDITFRDGDMLTRIEVNAFGKFDLKSEVEDDQINPAFWTKLPTPNDIGAPEMLAEQAREILGAFNPNYSPLEEYIAFYNVCKPRTPAKASYHPKGCIHKLPRETWAIYVKVGLPDDDWTAKVVVFHDGSPEVIQNVTAPKQMFR